MLPHIRKVVTLIEDTRIEGGRVVPRPFTVVVAAAVIANPWAKDGFVEDLHPAVLALTPVIAEVLTGEVLKHLKKDDIETFGKAALVGTGGEVEHAAAMIHSLHFGNVCRTAVGGSSYMPFTQRRGAPGSSLNVPMKHKVKENEGSRSHFLTTEIIVPDSPAADEILVAFAVASGGRPHQRIGDRFIDMKQMANA